MADETYRNHSPHQRTKLAVTGARRAATRFQNDDPGVIREQFVLPREKARAKAKEWYDKYPSAAYYSRVEHWRELPGDVIEFTMVRFSTAD